MVDVTVDNVTYAITLSVNGSIVGNLNDLSDVTVATPTEGQGLTYTSGEWTNSTLSGSGDMLKSTYDIAGNGIVDNSEALGTSSLAQVLAAGGSVTSVNGFTGVVDLDTSDIDEATNLYYTDVRVAANSAVALNTAKNTNVSTSLSTGTVDGTSYGITSDGGVNDVILAQADTNSAGVLSAVKWDEIVANTAKVTNVSTNLSEGTSTETTVDVNSSDGTNATLASASTTRAGLLTKAKWDEIVANTSKVSFTWDYDYTDLINKPTIPTAIGDLSGDMDDITNGTTYVKTENNLTDAQVTILGNTSNTNTGDNATNTQYSSLVSNIPIATDVIWDAKGDLSVGTGANTASKLTVGTNDYVLTADSGEATGLKWAAAGGGSSPLTTKGDLYAYSTVDARLPVGTNDYVLVADSTQTLGMKWAANSAGFTDPMTTRGDIIYKNAAGTTTRLAAGTATYVLTSDGTDISWAAAGGGSGGAAATFERTYTGNVSTGRLIPISIPDELAGLDIKEVRLSLLGLPAGQALKVDVRKSGTATTDSIFTSDTEIEVGTAQTATNGVYTTGCGTATTVGTPGTTIDAARDTLAADDILWVYITQVGSTTAGADLVVTISIA